MSNSTPNQFEADSTRSTMAGSIGAGNVAPEAAAVQPAVPATALAEAQNSLPLTQYRGTKTVGSFTNSTEELAALLTTVGVHDLGWKRFIRCSGDDRVRWLNGMVTNFVGNLEDNTGCYAFVLNAQGRIQGDLDIYRRADSLWLETDATQIDTLTAFLDRFIIMDDVALEAQPHWTALGIAGPRAAAHLAEAGLTVPSSPMNFAATAWREHSIIVAAAHSALIPRYEIWMERESVLEVWNAMVAVGALPCGVDAIESLRVLEGTPAYSVDITAKDLPQETNQMRALHFNKGCYLGQ
jgi:folate-binding Fe-S cluster repair protein YgfZ